MAAEETDEELGLKVYISLVGFLYVSKVLTLPMGTTKEKFDYEFSFPCICV